MVSGDLDVFSFDGECVYEDLQCLRNKTNMPEEKHIRISSNFFLLCKQETNMTFWTLRSEKKLNA